MAATGSGRIVNTFVFSALPLSAPEEIAFDAVKSWARRGHSHPALELGP